MGICQFYSKYKEQLPDALYRSFFGYPHEGLKCLAGTPSGQDICILHLSDPDKNSHDFTLALIEAMNNPTIRNSANTGGFHYCFPREFKFSNFLGTANSKGLPNFWTLYFPNCIFFSNPFAGLENINILGTKKLLINLDSSIFAGPSTYIKPPSNNSSEFQLSRCKFISININKNTYPENVKPNLLIYGNDTPNSLILLNGIKIDGHLHLDSISNPIDFGSIDSRYFKGDEVTIENLTITGNISAPLIMRYIKVKQRFAIESANFLKHIVFENIQNGGTLVFNRAHFLNPNQSLLRGMNFSQGGKK